VLASQENFLTPMGKTPPLSYEVHCPLIYCICSINSTRTRTSQLQPLGTRAGVSFPTCASLEDLPPTRAGARNGSVKLSSSSGDGPVPRTRARDLSSIIAVALGLLTELVRLAFKRTAPSNQFRSIVRRIETLSEKIFQY